MPMWWHRMFRHCMIYANVSVPMYDFYSKGILVRCECGAVWAR